MKEKNNNMQQHLTKAQSLLFENDNIHFIQNHTWPKNR